MATVQDLKDSLASEQTRAFDVANSAIGAIDTLLNLSMWVLGIVAFVVGVLALFGYAFIASSAKKAAKDLAKSRVDEYIKGQEFSEKIEVSIRQEVKERMKHTVIMNLMTEDKEPNGGADAFPSVPGEK